jgi:hypothetical protein
MPTVQVFLGQSAHQRADERCQRHKDERKAEQVYLNTLAVYAVDHYLHCLGFETEWQSSDSDDIVMQTLLNASDLMVKSLGQVECRYLFPDEMSVSIPVEVWGDRICFVAVQLDDELNRAEILGFVEQVEQVELPLASLRSIDDLSAYLHQLQAVHSTTRTSDSMALSALIQLSQWLEGTFDATWQAIEDIFAAPPPALAWRHNTLFNRDSRRVSRVKLLDFGSHPGDEQIALLVGISQSDSTELEIEVQLCPTGNRTHLPGEIQVRLLDQSDQEIWQNRAATSEVIQLQFSGQAGERFKVELTVGDRQITENFVI